MSLEEKHAIGVNFAGRENRIGSVIGCAVEIKTNLFREYSFLRINKSMKGVELNKAVELTRRSVVHYVMNEVTPGLYDTTPAEEWEVKSIVAMLNNIYRFWEQSITIKTGLEREKFIELFIKFKPQNLKEKDLRIERWNLEPSENDKLSILAGLYARYQLNIQQSDIISVWGDIKNADEFIKLHPDCPHIRKKKPEEENHEHNTGKGREESKDIEGHSI